jgi:proteasome lid subunit RPN8/RPN11
MKADNLTPILPGIESLVAPFKFPGQPHEYKVTALRECPTPEQMQDCDTPEKVAAYWNLHVVANPYFDPERECLAVLLLNTRRRAKGHQLISIGTLDTLLVSPTSVFRLAIMTSAAAIVVAHNHPSGDASPSEADIKVTRDLIRAGQLLKVEVLDHVIIGRPSLSALYGDPSGIRSGSVSLAKTPSGSKMLGSSDSSLNSLPHASLADSGPSPRRRVFEIPS